MLGKFNQETSDRLLIASGRSSISTKKECNFRNPLIQTNNAANSPTAQHHDPSVAMTLNVAGTTLDQVTRGSAVPTDQPNDIVSEASVGLASPRAEAGCKRTRPDDDAIASQNGGMDLIAVVFEYLLIGY